MHGRTLAILGAAALSLGYPAAGEPVANGSSGQEARKIEPKAELKPAELEMQLAQRGDLEAPAAAAKRPRAARASSCRCGDLASQQR